MGSKKRKTSETWIVGSVEQHEAISHMGKQIQRN